MGTYCDPSNICLRLDSVNVNTHPFPWHIASLLPPMNFDLAESSTRMNPLVAIHSTQGTLPALDVLSSP